MRGALSGRLPARGSCLAAPGAGFRVLGGAVAGDVFGLGPEGFAGAGEVGVLGRGEDAFDGGVEAEVVGQVQSLVADAVLAAQGGRGVQVAGHRVAGLQPGGDVAAGAARARARRAASRPWAAPMAAARLRAVWPPPGPVQPASWLARASASANRAVTAGVSKVRASQEISGGSSGWPPRAGLTVMPKPWRGLPRGSPPGGAGSVTVTGPPPQSRPMASGTVRSSP